MQGVEVGTSWALVDPLTAARVFQSGRSVRVNERLRERSAALADMLARLGVVSTVSSAIMVEGRLWGAVMVASNEELPVDTEERLSKFTELIATAVANAESRSELAASRRRIVAASDETRRQIERDLHDGTQQRLVSLGLAVLRVQRLDRIRRVTRRARSRTARPRRSLRRRVRRHRARDTRHAGAHDGSSAARRDGTHGGQRPRPSPRAASERDPAHRARNTARRARVDCASAMVSRRLTPRPRYAPARRSPCSGALLRLDVRGLEERPAARPAEHGRDQDQCKENRPARADQVLRDGKRRRGLGIRVVFGGSGLTRPAMCLDSALQGRLTIREEDLLRAAIVFTGAGLDAATLSTCHGSLGRRRSRALDR